MRRMPHLLYLTLLRSDLGPCRFYWYPLLYRVLDWILHCFTWYDLIFKNFYQALWQHELQLFQVKNFQHEFQAQQAHQDGIRGKPFLWLQLYLGFGWTLGCIFFGLVAANSSYDCRISKQYLCQAALLLCGISIMAFTAVEGYKGYIVFVWSYGIFLGGYQYCLKVYIYEKVRARNFARAWGFAQSSTALPTLISIPLLSM